MTKYVDEVWFVTETCCNCHIQFAMTNAFKAARLSDRKEFYCPAGHGQHYTGESEETKLRRELERTNQMLESAQSRSQVIQQQRDEVQRAHSKMRHRVFNGVCPCCHRTFDNLARHMKSEHAGEMTLKTLRDAFGMTQGAVAKEIGIQSSYVSNHEHDKYVPDYAKQRIASWVEAHSGQPDTTESGK